MDAWRHQAEHAEREQQVIFRALIRIINAIRVKHGRGLGEPALITSLVTDRCANVLGAELLGRLLDPLVRCAAQGEGYATLAPQSHPVVMNTKGASASGKSSQRQRQRALAARIGADWANFALVSPDIFRKYLLDYETLGVHYKYAGMLTGEELRIVDQKLDRYMAEKAQRGQLSHLLVDRFRFDSFAPESAERGSNLLTRFGSDVFLFFMVTAPHLTVERAWERGLRVGRYKSVDDLLYHNVEAYSGMPELFFTWALNKSKRVHYEFLDNDVPKGDAPRTIAFGSNGKLTILRLSGLLNIDRYRKINIEAKSPRTVYPAPEETTPESSLGFLSQCIARLLAIDFVDPGSGKIALRVQDARLVGVNSVALNSALENEHEHRALNAALALLGNPSANEIAALDESVDGETGNTLGDLGPSLARTRH